MDATVPSGPLGDPGDDPEDKPRSAEPRAHDIYRTLIQLRFAETIGWIVDHASVEGCDFTMYGWALAYQAPAEAMQFLINGVPFQRVEWPLASPEVAQTFNELPFSQSCRFVCHHRATSVEELFIDDYACLSFVTPFGLHRETYRRSEFILNPKLEPPVPDLERINRVIAGEAKNYRYGGATMAKRLDAYLNQRFGRALSSFASVLDWGCGAGRVTRHLARLCTGLVTGIDIDADNIAWCAEAIPSATFVHGPLHPPLACPDGSFDLVITVSVFTHLDEATQFSWLAELRRIVRPGGIVLASIHGLAQLAWFEVSDAQLLETGRRGILVLGENHQLDGFIAGTAYYKNVVHSHDYVLSEWGKYFDVIEIVESMATNQDLVVMVRPA
jgi:SAM-dependent methyltransferase